MSDQEQIRSSQKELLEAAGGNFTGLALLTIGYLKAHQQSTLDFWHYIGTNFAKTWTQGITALEMAKESALEWVSVGAELVELAGDETHAMAVLSGWPAPGRLERYGGAQDEADELCEIMRPIAGRLGFEYEWKREGDRIILVYTRK